MGCRDRKRKRAAGETAAPWIELLGLLDETSAAEAAWSFVLCGMAEAMP
jgi:hypothetical protein